MLRTLVAIAVSTPVVSSPALAQSLEQFERNSQFERAMAVVDQIRGRNKLRCLLSIGNRPICECLSAKLPFALHISNYVAIASGDKAAPDYGQLSAADRRIVDQCVATPR